MLAGNRHSRRLAAYDGATRPFGVAVLLLPHRRSGSSKPLVAIAIHTCEAARQKADEVTRTPAFAVAQRKRRKVEALFSELKNLIGLRRLRRRRIKFVREQSYLAAAAQNLKRLVQFLNMKAQSAMAAG